MLVAEMANTTEKPSMILVRSRKVGATTSELVRERMLISITTFILKTEDESPTSNLFQLEGD
ncbi:hypothetical protein GGD63_001070 [Bradyrhizobium sp. cir1]|nr:hypothetical protein [Bradyrhizobium sp. cir1]